MDKKKVAVNDALDFSESRHLHLRAIFDSDFDARKCKLASEAMEIPPHSQKITPVASGRFFKQPVRAAIFSSANDRMKQRWHRVQVCSAGSWPRVPPSGARFTHVTATHPIGPMPFF